MYRKLVLILLCSTGFLRTAIAANGANSGGSGGRRVGTSSLIVAGNGTSSAIATAQASVADSASSVPASATDSAQALGTDSASSAAVSGTAVASPSSAAGTETGSSTANLALDPANVQTGSQSAGNANAEKAQAASATDAANFINFCSKKTLTNGLQVKRGSCNGIVMGDIPSTDNMVSTIITNPAPGENVAANTDFNVNIQVANLEAGSFTNPDSTYYAAPQALRGGQIIGHTHITIQTLGNDLTPATPPNAAKFVFFKGINDAGDGKGGLSASVKGGLPAGNYRVCTMTSASNHQPVLMPVAQRGAQDDCTKFTVGRNGNGNGNGNVSGNGNGNASASLAARSTGTPGGAAPGASDAATTSTATTGKKGSGSNTGGNRIGARSRFAARALII